MEVIKKVRRLNNIDRCSLFPCLHKTTVAEHSYHVAMLCLFVAEDLNKDGVTIDEPKMLRKALMHDVEEAAISDIPWSVKQYLKDNMDAKNALIRCVIDEFPYDTPKWFIELVTNPCDGSIEHKIVKLCDMLELIHYCAEETDLGNSYVKPMIGRAVAVCKVLNEEVKSSWVAKNLAKVHKYV